MSISTIKHGFFLLIILFLSACTQSTEKTKCNTKFSIKEFFEDKTIVSKKQNRDEKILVGFNKNNELIKEVLVSKVYSDYKQKNESFAFVSKYNLNKLDGFSLSYFDQNLTFVKHYAEGKKDGIYFILENNYPSLLGIYSNDKEIGMVAFWNNGIIRGTKFNAKGFKDSKKMYDNGQKAFEYITENSINYWVVYNPNGQLLLKYPRDNDFCKVQFFENGKEVRIPLYFDQHEFEEIYKKVKSSE